jgi:hypothetical protein
VSAIRWRCKDGWIYRFFPCTGSGLAGRLSCEDPPDLPFAGLQSALGSLPSVALSSAEANGFCWGEFKFVKKRVCFRFPFPWGL